MAKRLNRTATPDNVGQTWHVLIPGRKDLITAVVKEVTAETVLLAYNPKSKFRFRRDDVDFVEQAK